MVIFATQDLVKGPTFTRLDLISCRNVMIYMGAQLQKRLIPLFHYCLNPGGILFLGTSETVGAFTDVFSAVDNKARIFQAKRVKSPPLPKAMRTVQIPDMPCSGDGEEESAGALLDRALLALAGSPGGAAIADNIREVVGSRAAKAGKGAAGGKEAAGKERPQTQPQVHELRERLQTTVEELETSNEELRSANEELESVNEELLTLNAEFQNKIDELADAHANMDILLEGAQIATVFLGGDLRIRSFTPSIAGIINLVPSDVGRSLRDFSSHVDYPNMMGDLAQVVETGNPVENTVRHEDGMWYLARVLPYRRKGRIDGVAITFIDVTEQKKIQQKLQDAMTYAEGIVETVREPLLILDVDLRVITGNDAFYRTFQVTKEDTEGRRVYDLGNRQWDIPALRRLLEDILPQRSRFADYVVEHTFQTIGRRTMRLNARQIMQAGLGTAMILLAIEDITGAPHGASEDKS
jgi:PAS domain-containing protein